MARKKSRELSRPLEDVQQLPDILGHKIILKALRRYQKEQWRGGTLLISGAEGIGKALVVRRFIMGYVCENHVFLGCQDCGACKQFLRGYHPDVCVIQPAGEHFTVKELEALMNWTTYKPVHLDVKILALLDIEKMRIVQANALLKTLEEPPADGLILLTTSNLMHVLPTIRSRAQLLRTTPVPENEIEDMLFQIDDIPAPVAGWIARLSEGKPGIALTLAKNWKFHYEFRNRVFTWVERWLENPNHDWSRYFEIDLRDLMDIAPDVPRFTGWSADGWTRTRWWYVEALKHFLFILRDIVYLHAGLSHRIVARDLSQALEHLTEFTSFSWILDRIEDVLNTLGEIHTYHLPGVWQIPGLEWPPPDTSSFSDTPYL